MSPRWMRFSTSNDGTIYYVDTLTSDIKQLSSYDGHYSVVILWANLYKKTVIKKVAHITQNRYKMAIDTLNNQYEIKEVIEYSADNAIKTTNYDDRIKWVEVVPDSIAEILIKYAKKLE